MNFFIVFFLPCILGLFIYYKLVNKKKKFDLSVVYLLNVLFTNILNMIVLYLRNTDVYNLGTKIEGNFRFSLKYILLSLIMTTVISIIFVIIKKYISITIEVKNGKKKKK